MIAWTSVAAVAEFPLGTCRRLVVDGISLAIFNAEGRYFAIEDVCSHEAESLSNGRVEGLEIICPRHAARFSLLTGEALSPPAYEPVAVFPVRIEHGLVQVGDQRLEQSST
jgi:3-phenylpropionate/trans-cinnamate dioxygenase ferredoxin subunit